MGDKMTFQEYCDQFDKDLNEMQMIISKSLFNLGDALQSPDGSYTQEEYVKLGMLSGLYAAVHQSMEYSS